MKNILAENMRRFGTKNLSEQITEALPTIPFNESFLDNMVKVYKTPQLTTALDTLDKNIIAAKKERDMKLQSISISINAGSTPLPATNSLPAGVTKPDHDYGGTLSLNVCKPGQSDQCWLPTARRDERVLVPDGNTFLANQRALNLKVYLEQHLKGKYPGTDIAIKINNIDQSSTKFASAVINGIIWNTEFPTEQFRWDYLKVNRMYYNGPLIYHERDITGRANSWTTISAEGLLHAANKLGLLKGSKQIINKSDGVVEFIFPTDINKKKAIVEIEQYFDKFIPKQDHTTHITGKELYNILNTQIPSLKGKILENPPAQVNRVLNR